MLPVLISGMLVLLDDWSVAFFELSSHLQQYDNLVSFENNSTLECKFFFEWKVVLNFQWEMESGASLNVPHGVRLALTTEF